MTVAHTPRWSIRPPDEADVAAFLAAARDAPLSYREVGASSEAHAAPPNYNLDHNRALIGRGPAAFAAACDALRDWRMFPGPWTRILPCGSPTTVGNVVVMQAHALGLWWLSACRIVYAIDDAAPVRRFGFAYGTLLPHVEQGEERFMVELHADGSVWYDLRAFSRPRYWPVRLAKPLARRLQRRFVLESQRAMRAAVEAGAALR